MKAAVYYGNTDLRWEDVPDPETRPGHVKVRVAHNGICGTDIHEFFEGPMLTPVWPHLLTGVTLPVVLGHEFSGTVVEVGDGVTRVTEGDRVAIEPVINCGNCHPCRRGDYNLCDISAFLGLSSQDGGGLGEYVVVDAGRVHVLPENVSLESGAVIEPLSVATHAVRRANSRPDDRIVVHGAGPVGLGIIQTLALRGAERIIVSETSALRRSVLESMKIQGVEAILDPTASDICQEISARVDDIGADLTFVVAGRSTAKKPDGSPLIPLNTAMESTRRGGRVVSVATHPEMSIHPDVLTFKELTVIGSAAYTKTDFELVLDAMKKQQYTVEPWVEHRQPTDIATAMADMRDGKACKVLIDL
ncbi:alcohol dehydrogenase catalytic domain-containing protein [Rhodococcus sp. T2V]|uniref:alcohol dehydrogenase catalytic domain-containing protein n=1 Tax=Rhodococcus sp. T2V TaxID=3034164 RepID=UPI0023E16453|nr:alcohol dehydrogenase catalytic domain-containing protein [Rhodococcus sp. T2V]MDF3310575.1 alcohol dehydrogenase catalytic domain-containing protein [Rhodococcus sp. T2V]